jgi:hypothetical protein
MVYQNFTLICVYPEKNDILRLCKEAGGSERTL